MVVKADWRRFGRMDNLADRLLHMNVDVLHIDLNYSVDPNLISSAYLASERETVKIITAKLLNEVFEKGTDDA